MKRSLLLLPLLLLAGCRVSDCFALLPGHSMVVTAQRAVRVRVQAEYPVTVQAEDCRAVRVVDVSLTCSPADLLITDTRPSFLIWGRANNVTVSTRWPF